MLNAEVSELLNIKQKTMKPPYYAVIFTSVLTENQEGYDEIADRMEALAKEQDGFLGVESARNEIGITVSYWKDLASIKKWKENMEHLQAQKKGRESWYKNYTIRIALVEREYSFEW
jgi:heme-degrading monooxygenase HmoA